MSRLIIVGAGVMGALVTDLARSCGYTDFGYFDDGAGLPEGRHLGRFNEIESYVDEYPNSDVCLALGYQCAEVKSSLFRVLRGRCNFPTLVHPTAWVSPSAQIAPGCLLFAQSLVEMSVVLDQGVCVFQKAGIAHDCRVGESTIFAWAVVVTGRVEIGQRCFLGANSTVANDITIGDDCVVGAATLVSRSIDAGSRVVGNPMRVVESLAI